MRRLEKVVHKLFCEQDPGCRIQRFGSSKKKTDTERSDVDVYVVTEYPMDRDDQKSLVRELRREFGEECVSARNLYQKITLPSRIKMDVQPRSATFLPKTKQRWPRDRFARNKKGRQAVRLLKQLASKKDYQWKGRLIEMSVVWYQMTHKGSMNFQIADGLVKFLNKAISTAEPEETMKELLQIYECTHRPPKQKKTTKDTSVK